MGKTYVWDHKIQYYETDQMQIAHHSNYIRWFEEARTAAMEEAGLGYEEMEAAGVISPVVSVSAKYHKMSRFPETLRIAVEIADYNGARMRLRYRVTEKTSGELRCTGESEHCYLEAAHKLISLKRSKPEIHAILDAMK